MLAVGSRFLVSGEGERGEEQGRFYVRKMCAVIRLVCVVCVFFYQTISTEYPWVSVSAATIKILFE